MDNRLEKIKKILSFSLLELLIGLVTLSTLIAAFSPVISKRLQASSYAQRAGISDLLDCSAIKDETGSKSYCKVCKKNASLGTPTGLECMLCIKQCKDTE